MQAELTPAQARMAHARAQRGSGAPMPTSARYDAIRKSQARSDKLAATKRANLLGKGIVLPDDSEEPFDPNPAIVPEGMVRVRCLRRGHNKISMGVSLPLEVEKFPNFHQGDIFVLPEDVANLYENDDKFGWVETVE